MLEISTQQPCCPGVRVDMSGRSSASTHETWPPRSGGSGQDHAGRFATCDWCPLRKSPYALETLPEQTGYIRHTVLTWRKNDWSAPLIRGTANVQSLLSGPDNLRLIQAHINTEQGPSRNSNCHRSSAGRVKMMATSQTRCVLSDLPGASGQPGVHTRGRIFHPTEEGRRGLAKCQYPCVRFLSWELRVDLVSFTRDAASVVCCVLVSRAGCTTSIAVSYTARGMYSSKAR